MQTVYQRIKGDKVIWTVILLLSIVSLLAVYSSINSLAYKHHSGNQFYYLIKHGSFLIGGFFIMYFIHKIRYTLFSRIAQLSIFLAVPLLLITLLRGANINEAARWLPIPGTGFTFQTSDLAKIALIMYLARTLSKIQDKNLGFKQTSLYILLPVAIVCGLILPANFSTAALLFTTSMIMMFVGRVKTKFLLSYLGMGVVAILLIVAIGKTFPTVFKRFATWEKRIERFIKEPQAGEKLTKKEADENFQSDQAKIAIATGGITGKGPGKSTQRNFLPHPYSDFIFAFIIEEYGIFGAISIIGLYLILLFRGVRIATRSQKTFGSLLAFGICFSLVFQAFINMAVASNLFPVTGQPLPLVSMGGTSVWFTSIAIGIVLSVSVETEKNEKDEQAG